MTIMELIVASYFNEDGLTIEGCNMSEDNEPVYKCIDILIECNTL